jgi:DNA-binding GntR family transcriptional regulator
MSGSTRRNAQPEVPRRTLAAVITSQLRQRIIDGTYAPGTQMNEVELAAEFATSRGPVREGMQRLVQEGLLTSVPHRGITVPMLTAQDLEDLYFARAAIERASLLRLADRGVPAGVIADMEQALATMALAIDREDWRRVSEADLRFHRIVVKAAGSPRLTDMYESLAGQTQLGLNLLVDTYQGRQDLLEEHTQLFELIGRRDRKGLMEALDKHFNDAMRTLGDHYPAHQDTAARRTS